MNRKRSSDRPHAFTLVEIVLVVGILLAVTAMVVPNFFRQLQSEELPGSARQLRSLLTLVRANAALDGKRYRFRFPEEDEEDPQGGDRQPIIEREDDPIDEPGMFHLVTDPWAFGKTLLGAVWCAEVRLGRPTVARLQDQRSQIQDAVSQAFEEFSPERPPLMIEPDGTSDWATFVLVAGAPRGINLDELDDYERIEVILEGPTGLAWLQRPFYQEELDLFEEKHWPVVLRQDFLDSRVLTEDDVLELREVFVKP